MNFWQSMAGAVKLELVSANPLETVQKLAQAGIPVSQLESRDALTCCFCIPRGEYGTVARLCEKRGDRISVSRRQGLYWTVRQLAGRPVLVSGLAGMLALMLFLPTRVLFLKVEGNETVPARRILACAEDCGLGFGTVRREVRSEQVKNGLLAQIPQLQWAGVNTAGCTATILVRERPAQAPVEQEQEVCSIVAAQDGVILSVTATRGNLVCREGQAVQRGQVLVSGYTDCGLSIRATRAEGEIFAQTSRVLTAVTPDTCLYRVGEGKTKRYYSILFGKKRINFLNTSGIPEGTCGRIYVENYLTLPGGFRLPIAIAWEDVTWYPLEAWKPEPQELEDLLRQTAESCLQRRMIAGTVLQSREQWGRGQGFYQLTGQYSCREMIGIPHREEIGEYHGKTG